jgi:hypothetical protein
MDSALLRKVVGLGIAALVLFLVLYYFAAAQVTDTKTPQIAREIGAEFGRSLEKGAAPKLTMHRLGKGPESTREYTARFQPSAAVASDQKAVARLCERVAGMVSGKVDDTRRDVTFVMIAQRADGTSILERAFLRRGGEVELEEIPVPPRRTEPQGTTETETEEE